MLGIIFVSIKSQRNLIAPNLGTKLLQAGIIIIGFTMKKIIKSKKFCLKIKVILKLLSMNQITGNVL